MGKLFGVSYALRGNAYHIAESGLIQWFNLKIPPTKNGYPVVAVDEMAFIANSDICSLTLPSSIRTIGKYAFQKCSALRTAVIEAGDIGDRAFMECKNLHTVVLGEGVTSIGKEAFKGCKKLKSVTLPNSLTSLAQGAFFECPNIEYINIPTSMTVIENNSFFYFKNVRRFHIHKWVSRIEDGAFAYCNSVEQYTVDEENPFFKAINGDLYTKDGSTLIAYASGKKDTEFLVPEGVLHIGMAACAGSASLKSIELPEGVLSIKFEAFGLCPSLESVTIPRSVTDVDRSICWQSNKNITFFWYFSERPEGWDEAWNDLDFDNKASVVRKKMGKSVLD